jgi:1-acyl-sn-glycerol-3-phosphate acyltransferase
MKPFYRLCWLLVRTYLNLFCKLKIRGLDKVPLEGGIIIAPNHISAGDPPFIAVCVNRELSFLAKKELFKNVFLRTLISNLNAIPVDRSILDQKALAAAEKTIRDGYGLIMFPEGTRSRSGELKKGKPGVGLLARKAQVPIVPAIIENSYGFHKLLFTGKSLKVSFGDPIPRELIVSFPDDKEGYRGITEEIMRRLAILSAENSGEVASPQADKRPDQP